MKKILFLFALLVSFFCFNLEIQAAQYQVTFEWNANTEADLAGYRLYMSSTAGQYSYGAGNALASVGKVTTVQVPVEVTEGQKRYFVLTALDESGNESGPSNEVSWTAPDVTAPAPPSNFLLKLWARLLAWLHTIRF